MTDKYYQLKNAIVLDAVNQYTKALKKLIEQPGLRCARLQKQECEVFFQSEWFYSLTGKFGFPVMVSLRKEIKGTDKTTKQERQEYKSLQLLIREGIEPPQRRHRKELLAFMGGKGSMDYE